MTASGGDRAALVEAVMPFLDEWQALLKDVQRLTPERVSEMLAYTSRKPDEIAGHMRSNQFRNPWEFTVEKVAVNAVMAGARPEYFPVILALASSGVSARGSTTSSMAAMAVVNGPIRQELNMNSGIGAMAPYNHANATIGRGYGLLSQNLQGGSIPGDSYMGSQGNGYAYGTVTFAENEERSPWPPFHVQHGFKTTDSTVSIFTGCRSTAFTLGVREKYWREHVRNMLHFFAYALQKAGELYGVPSTRDTPTVTRLFSDRGLPRLFSFR